MLSSEHRAAPASASVYLELVATDAETTHLEVIAELQDGQRRSLEEQVLELLAPGTVLAASSAILWRSRTSAWAWRWSRWSEPASSAARPRAGSVSTDHRRVPFSFPRERWQRNGPRTPNRPIPERGATVPGVDFDKVRTEIR